ncbi:MAG: hypothetical protein WAO08_33200 [Hyphomicrobiaceae bacterium]
MSLFFALSLACPCFTLSGGEVMAQKREDLGKQLEEFDRNKFDRSTDIDNKWFPLKPGTQYVYKGSTQEEKKRLPHRVVFVVTDLAKVINGVKAIVVWELDYQAGNLVEQELVFFAQDKDGNVWHLGQLSETYDEKEFVGARAFLVGTDGATAGIMMPAEPRAGTPSYSQGYAPPPYNWTDRGRVDQVGQKTCVPTGCYNDILVIAETSNAEGPKAEQLKYYAPGMGLVRVGWRGKAEKLRETLELAEIVNLGPEALAKARAEALELEKRAYVYGRTPPAELMRAAERQ